MSNRPAKRKGHPGGGQAGVAIHAEAQRYRGPIPPASELARHEATLPGSADRIITMAEQVSAHHMKTDAQRAEAEIRLVDGAIRSDAFGQWFGFIVAILSLAAFTFLSVSDKPIGSIFPALLGVANIIAILRGQSRRK